MISDTAFGLITANFSVETLKISALTGKRDCPIFDAEKMELMKFNTLMAVGGTDFDWANSLENLQTKLRNYRKNLK